MKLRLATLVCGLLLLTTSLPAQVISWSGATNTDFATGTNWLGGNAPASSESALFPSTATGLAIDVNAPATVVDLTFSNNSFTLGGSSVLTVTGNISLANSYTSLSGPFTLELSATNHTITADSSSTLQVLSGSAITGSGSLTLAGTGFLTLNSVNSYAGGTTVSGGSLNVLNGGVISHVGTDMSVGGTGAGGLLGLNIGSSVTNNVGHIGILAGDTGSVTLQNNSIWTNAGYLYVGEAGSGSLNLDSGSAVNAANVSIGNNTGGSGAVVLSGTGVTLSQTDVGAGNGLYVGSQGTGSLHLMAGAVANSVTGSVGNNTGGIGTAVVNGSGSKWDNSGNLFVGAAGTGTLSILNGGRVESLNVTVGNNTGGFGTLTVDGSGSALALDSGGALRVGWQSNGALQVRNGATATATTAVLGENLGASGTAKIFGSGSTLSVTGTDFYVGNGGNGIMYLYDSGKVNVGAGTGTLHLSHSPGGAGILKIGNDGTSNFAGGIVNAATITSGAGVSGELKFYSTTTAANPYYLTKDGTAGGAAVVISGPTEVHQANGYTVLKGVNTYTGATHIDGGTLVAGSNAAFGSSTVTVQNGATLALASGVTLTNTFNFGVGGGTLAGNGNFTGPLTLGSGGVTLSPGLIGPGSLNFASGLTANDQLAAKIEIRAPTGTAGTDWDVIDVTGTFNLTPLNSSGFTLKVISLTLANAPGAVSGLSGPTSWDIAITTTLTGFNAADFAIDSSQFVGGGNFTLSQVGQNLVLNFTPVPEPSTYALLLTGLAATAFAARRKRRT